MLAFFKSIPVFCFSVLVNVRKFFCEGKVRADLRQFENDRNTPVLKKTQHLIMKQKTKIIEILKPRTYVQGSYIDTTIGKKLI